MDPFAKLTFGDAFVAIGLVVLFVVDAVDVVVIVVIVGAVVVAVPAAAAAASTTVDDIVFGTTFSFSPVRSRCGER